MNILNVGYTSTNYYILAEAKPLLLIDVGFAGTLAKLQHELKRMDVKLGDIKHLLATHYHPDHAGLALELQKMGMKLVVVDVQQAAIEAVQGDPKLAKQYVGYDRKAAVTISLEGSRTFLKGIGIKGEIIATPGHSDDSVSLILDTGEVFNGDLPRPLPGAEGNMITVGESWEAIKAHGGKVSHPGHGPVYKIVDSQ
ncbi:MAG: MBL fold metallo-hydrolase [Chloroflexi bacterium]|nr:MBL fold metallo-hydrolase [Chloroflexota bacterium]MCC6896138.1 MBL fold metallo-hydrolase [Anaerolineae bacterium]